MPLSTIDELRTRFDTLTKRIEAKDIDIGRETDTDRLRILQDQRLDLAREREQVAAELGMMDSRTQYATKGTNLDGRVEVLEHTVAQHDRAIKRAWRRLSPGPRHRLAIIASWVILVAYGLSLSIDDVQVFYFSHPIHAMLILIVVIALIALVRWLPEDDNDDDN